MEIADEKGGRSGLNVVFFLQLFALSLFFK